MKVALWLGVILLILALLVGSYFSMAQPVNDTPPWHCGAYLPTRTPTPPAPGTWQRIYLPLVMH